MANQKKPNLPPGSSSVPTKERFEKPLTSQKEPGRHQTMDRFGFGMDDNEIMPVSAKAKTPPRPPKK